MAGANAAYRRFRNPKALSDRERCHRRFSQLMNFGDVLIRYASYYTPTISRRNLLKSAETEPEEVKPRRRRTRQEVQRLVSEFGASGLSRGEFCRIHGINSGLNLFAGICKNAHFPIDRVAELTPSAWAVHN